MMNRFFRMKLNRPKLTFLVCLIIAFLLKVTNAVGQQYNVDPNLEPYLEQFVEEAKEKGIDLSYIYDENITIEFTDKKDNKVASAPSWQYRKTGILIKVRRDRFYGLRTEQGRKYAMFHEFGHDILNLEHSKVGMMRASSFSGFFLPHIDEDRQNGYLYKSLNEMFDIYLNK